MKRLILQIAISAAVALTGCYCPVKRMEWRTDDGIGRYELEGTGQGAVYRLDTKTGETWFVSGSYNEWLPFKV